MSAITASQVKELRERTGAGMMECKKALVASAGDMSAAIEAMRKSGIAKAAKKAGRIAAEGLVAVSVANDGHSAAMVEINCETDFVARDEGFVSFAKQCAEQVLHNSQSDDTDALLASPYQDSEQTVEQFRQELLTKIGENIHCRRAYYQMGDYNFGSYVHGNRIGVVVALEGGDAALAKDIAMHIAANNPMALDENGLSSEVVAKEREIIRAQSEGSGKPADIVAKMVEGRLKKYFAEVTLLGQVFVKSSDGQTVAKLLSQAQAKVVSYQRFEVGEGIEKKQDNFVEEVMAQARGE